jgi:NADPH:quinone reductase-like Zn-dependent oxidoreductase
MNSDEILVRVGAVALNYRDKVVVDGIYLPHLQLPFTPASDAAGVVVEAGKEVTRFRVGDRVIVHYRRKWLDGDPGPEEIAACVGGPLPGVLAEYVVLPEYGAVATPSCLDDCEASTLPIAGLTAWFALLEDGQLRPGDWVLVEGTGGVSLFALQFAKAAGARVLVTSRSDEKLERAKALGAFGGVNYVRTRNWDKTVLDFTSGKGVACVIETAGGTSLQRSIDALAINGRIEVIGFLEGVQADINILSLVRKRAQIRGVAVGHRRAFERMNCALESLQLKPVIDSVYDFLQLPQAFQHLERGGFGKIVIRLGR